MYIFNTNCALKTTQVCVYTCVYIKVHVCSMCVHACIQGYIHIYTCIYTQVPVTGSHVRISDNSFFADCTVCLSAGDSFGRHIAVLPDLDSNGIQELAVAAKGTVWVLYMGRDTSSNQCTVCTPKV